MKSCSLNRMIKLGERQYYLYKHVFIVNLAAEPFRLLQSTPDLHPSNAFPNLILFILSSKLNTVHLRINNVLAPMFSRRCALSVSDPVC